MIGDSKLISYANLAAMTAEGVAFIASASKIYVPAEVLARQRLDQAQAVDYVAARDAGKDAWRRGTWHVAEDGMTLAGSRKKDPILALPSCELRARPGPRSAEHWAPPAKAPPNAPNDSPPASTGH